jgi:hypothetical protein
MTISPEIYSIDWSYMKEKLDNFESCPALINLFNNKLKKLIFL